MAWLKQSCLVSGSRLWRNNSCARNVTWPSCHKWHWCVCQAEKTSTSSSALDWHACGYTTHTRRLHTCCTIGVDRKYFRSGNVLESRVLTGRRFQAILESISWRVCLRNARKNPSSWSSEQTRSTWRELANMLKEVIRQPKSNRNVADREL